MGIYGLFFALLLAAIVFLVVVILFGKELGAKAAGAVLTAIGTIPIIVGVSAYFGIWVFGIGC